MAFGIRGFVRRLIDRVRRGGAERQFGAIPYRPSGRGLEVLLITSRGTGRWIFPKGGRIGRLSPAASAAQEAWEEAGVAGRIGERPLGRYRSVKRRGRSTSAIDVEVYPLAVEAEAEDWPERRQRRRRWAAIEEAATLLSEPGLVEILRALPERLAHEDGAG